MWPPRPIYERIPQLWFLLGLLFISTGLYLGFEYSLAFLYMMIGWFCCAFGVAIFVLRLRERPKVQAEGGTRKPSEFASANPADADPAQPAPDNNDEPAEERQAAE